MQAYDQHLNMILGEVEEVVTTVEIDDETYEEIVRVRITYSAFSSCVDIFVMLLMPVIYCCFRCLFDHSPVYGAAAEVSASKFHI